MNRVSALKLSIGELLILSENYRLRIWSIILDPDTYSEQDLKLSFYYCNYKALYLLFNVT